ncbi:MAG: ATP-binding cassette domain-containing protein [Bacteroidota bacterium]
MSEEVLNAILRLLAIVAAEDAVTDEERSFIQNYLKESLDRDAAKHYINVFDQFASEVVGNQTGNINTISEQINLEQTAQQKVVVILNLVILIAADGIVTDRENELLYLIGDNLNIDKEIIDLIKAFVIHQERSKITSSNVLIIDNGQQSVNPHCRHLIKEEVEGFILLLRIPDVDLYFLKYLGEKNILINGDIMRTDKIYNFSTGSAIKLENSAIYHSEIVGMFRELDAEHHLTFIAKDVTYKFSNGKTGLFQINVLEESGRLVALMGGSGAGKSTLLNVLNGNETPSEGSVRINGIDIHKEKGKIEGVIGYVPQDDLLIEELTVFDNLFFAAKLCFNDLSGKELKDLVNHTLESLGLFETRKLKVGSPLEKTISGGQRKRLNIGLELLREPSVLFVDEPTSGLSSRDSENIMDLLKELSLKGKLVFVVIHQPSIEIFRMFDQLLILDVGGYQIYYGNPLEAVGYFKNAVKIVDQGRNNNPEQIFNIIESKVVNEFGNFTKQRKISPKEWWQMYQENLEAKELQESTAKPKKTTDIPSAFSQWRTFTIRDFKSKVTNKQYLSINLIEGPLLALLLSVIIRYMPEDTTIYHFKENLNIPVFFFMSVIVALFMGLTVSAEEIIRDRKVLKREEFLNLSRLSYLLSKVFILFSLSAIQTISFVIIGELIMEVKGMTLIFWLTLFSVSCFANTLGLIISAAFKSAVTVYILIPLLIIPQIILSGVVVSFDKLNPMITTEDKVPMIGEIMTSRWAFEALAVEQFTNNEFERQFYAQDKILGESEFKTSYLYPRLTADLEFVYRHLKEGTEAEKKDATYRLKTVQNELRKALGKIGSDQFPQIESLTPDKYSAEVHDTAIKFISDLRRYYSRRYKAANDEKNALLKNLTSSPEKEEELNELRKNHENEAIGFMVKNTGTEHRILEHDNHMIQKIYPIYMDPEYPDHLFDFRAQFFQPNKYLLGRLFPTPLFNIAFIWMMTIVLFIALYFNWLKLLLSGLKRRS